MVFMLAVSAASLPAWDLDFSTPSGRLLELLLVVGGVFVLVLIQEPLFALLNYIGIAAMMGGPLYWVFVWLKDGTQDGFLPGILICGAGLMMNLIFGD